MQIRVGGDFVYRSPADRVLFIAGGVGINPIYAMLKQLDAEHTGVGCGGIAERAGSTAATRAALLYSARQRREFVFRSKLTEMEASRPQFLKTFYATTAPELRDGTEHDEEAGEAGGARGSHCDGIDLDFCGGDEQSGRIDAAMISNAIQWLGATPTTVYICGPPGMAEALASICNRQGVPVSQIYYESWW